jgi:flagellar assembly factor FliW
LGGPGGKYSKFSKKIQGPPPTFEKENKFKFKTPLPTLFKNQIKMSVADLCSKVVLSKPYDLFKKYKQTVSQQFCSTRH